ncbi:MAG: hypothetical protein H6658_09285 [Ardenticatenaceae bacterium]|nr:hypothetical protein [Ardenticatenaceae bacterium]
MLDDLLDRLFESRERLLVALEVLPDEALWQPGAVGEWSLVDLLNVLTAWESELVTAMMRLEKGQKPENLLVAMAEPEVFVARVVAQGRERGLDAIFDDLQGARMHVEEWLEFFSERQLTNPKQFRWLGGKSLMQVVAAYSTELEQGFLPMVEVFVAGWEDAGESPLNVIPLSAVIPLENDDEESD